MTIRLFARRTVVLPTLWGWLTIAVFLLATGFLTAHNLVGYLSPSHPLKAKFLVIEGWLPDYALEQAKVEFQSNHYQLMFTTGVPLETGEFLSNYGTFARRARETLITMGVPESLVVAVPAQNAVRDRTRASAEAIRAYFDRTGISAGDINLVSLGAHGRRSALLFRRALGRSRRVGILSLTDRSYDAGRWWASSEGFRIVSGEAIALLYALSVGR